MSYWQSASSDLDDRLAELSKLFLACRDAFHETADTYQWIPAPGSPAANDADALPSPDPGIVEPRGETGHRLIAEVAQIFLLTATGHLGGLASLYASNDIIFSSALLLRAVIENCAHALWVLGDDPDEPAENRLARAYLEDLYSAEEAKKNAGRMRGKTHESHVHAEQAYTTLKSQILARYPEATRQSLGEGTLLNQKIPGLEAAVKWMYSLTEAAGGTITQEQASGIYGYLSNMTHPTLYPVRQHRGWYDDSEKGSMVAYLRVDLGSVEDEARAAIAAFYNAMTYTTSYFGWPAKVMDRLEAKIAAAIPKFFR